jgi:hypothetical protein
MFPLNDYVLFRMAQNRERELVEKARINLLLQEAKAVRPGLWARSLSKSGEFLILFGQKLKSRYEPPAQTRLALPRPCPQVTPCD